MVGSRWMFRAVVMVVLCALPGLVFAVEIVAPRKAIGNQGQLGVPSVKTERPTAAPIPHVQNAPSRVETAPVAAQASQDVTKTVKNLSDQVASLKQELDQLKKSGQAQSRPGRKRHAR